MLINKKGFVYASLFFLVGLVSILLFSLGFYFPIFISVVIFAIILIHSFQEFRKNHLGIVMFIMLLIFLLPFIHIPPYLFFDFNTSPEWLWGLFANEYMWDKKIIQLTAMLGSTGAAGIAFGNSIAYRKIKTYTKKTSSSRLSLVVWFIWVFIGLFLSQISAPKDTILEAKYTLSESIHQNWNFSSAWLMSYLILTFAFVDSIRDKKKFRKQLKIKVIIITIIYIVIWLQLLRGDRESLAWVFSLAIAFYYYGEPKMHITKKMPWIKISLLTFGIFFIAMIVGSTRRALTDLTFEEAASLVAIFFENGVIGLDKMLHGTWSAILLTPLSVAGDYDNNLLNFKYGKDYLDLLLSVPPGFITDAIGFQRPIDAFNGPAWEMTYGMGGTHAVVLPFRNFGMIGVFLIPALWAYVLNNFERNTQKNKSIYRISFLSGMIMSAPHWLWYGEKIFINTLIIMLILFILYKISISLNSRSTSNNLIVKQEIK